MIYNYNEMKRKSMRLVAISNGKTYEGEFIDFRIDKDTIPQGKFMYQCRHDDDGNWIDPVTIETRVLVNFCGTLIMDREIEFPDHFRTIYIERCWFE